MKDKKRRRDEILSQIEAKWGMIKVLQNEARSLSQSLPEEWVVRSTVLTQRSGAWGTGAPAGTESYHGDRNPGTVHHVNGFVTSDPHSEMVQVFKTPDAAKRYAQCAVDKDRGFDRQAWYKIEVVDRVDGEVFCEIPCRSAYIKAIESGVPLSEAAKLL